MLTATAGPDQHVALALVEVEGLAALNAALGHHHVDRLLVEVARTLDSAGPGADVVARIGGNEFAVLSRPAATAHEAVERARAVAGSIAHPLDVDGHAVEVVSHLGVAVAPEHGQDPRSLLRSADAALQHSKADVLPFSVYDPTEERSSLRRIGLLTQLRQGLANHDLELRFQPLVELRTGRVTKVEALLRWQREDGGARLPLELLELAEQSGLIQPLTRWVLGEAARVAGRLGRPGERTVVSANLSLRNLYDDELLSFLELLLASGELPADLVEVEINEVELTDDPVRAQQIVSRLARMGLRVVVDNFGTGYTSMTTMANLAVAGVKIDRSFISTLSSVPADLAVVRSTIDVAHTMGLTVTAEGVADADTLAQLVDMGCDHAQGFHLSGPVTFEELPSRVTELEDALRPWLGSTSPIRLS
jgi:diguanylate cyclase (GGDEF)-like protein